MIDCGYRANPFFFPSIQYMFQDIEMLVLQNLDTDHLGDLPSLLRNNRVKAIRSNPTISSDAFLAMKQSGGMNEALTAMCHLLAIAGPTFGPAPSFPDFWWHYFWNAYGLPFADTNNLSMPIFIGNDRFCMLLGGDLEDAGWQLLLQSSAFRQRLSQVRVLVPSHHGRDNGCCEALFGYCYPEVVIISDCEHKHESQDTASWYAYRVRGIPDTTDPMYFLGGNPIRKVLTTRRDGSLKIDVRPDGRYTVFKDASSSLSIAPALSPKLDWSRL